MIKLKILGDNLEVKEILELIENNIKDKHQITDNLRYIIKIAKDYNHRTIFEWAHWKLNGYKDIEALPQYRK